MLVPWRPFTSPCKGYHYVWHGMFSLCNPRTSISLYTSRPAMNKCMLHQESNTETIAFTSKIKTRRRTSVRQQYDTLSFSNHIYYKQDLKNVIKNVHDEFCSQEKHIMSSTSTKVVDQHWWPNQLQSYRQKFDVQVGLHFDTHQINGPAGWYRTVDILAIH